MARSRIAVLGVVAGVSLACLAACNVVLGLGDYEKVDADGGAADAASEAADAQPDVAVDAPPDVEPGTYDPTRAWAKWKMPNPDGGDGGPPNTASYAAGDAGTVFDNVTKLKWESVGMNAPTAMTVTKAQTYCAGLAAAKFAGVDDWRLPTRIELVTLIDYTRAGPTIDPVFANTPAQPFWSASPAGQPNPGKIWRVDFLSGEVRPADDPSPARVRCVSRKAAS